MNPDLQALVEKAHEAKAAREEDCIEACLSSPQNLPYAEGLGLDATAFDDESFRIIFKCLPLLADKPEETRVRMLGLTLKSFSYFDDTAIASSRGTQWSSASLLSAGRSWPKGLSCFDATVQPLLEINGKLTNARAFYLSALRSLGRVA